MPPPQAGLARGFVAAQMREFLRYEMLGFAGAGGDATDHLTSHAWIRMEQR